MAMRIISLQLDAVFGPVTYEVGRIEWEDGRISYVSAVRMQDLLPTFLSEDRIEFEGEANREAAITRAG